MSFVDAVDLDHRLGTRGGKPKTTRARVESTPASANDALVVKPIGFADTYDIPPTNWSPRGAALPAEGSHCLVELDHMGDAWVTQWEGVNDESGPPVGPAGGDLGGAYPNPTVVQLGGRAVSAVVFGDDARLTNSRTPTGSAGGDLSGTYPNPTVSKVGGRSGVMFGGDTAGGALSGTYPNPTIKPPTWSALPLNTSNWQNYPSPSWAPAEYCVEQSGFVSLRGLVRTTTAFTFGTASATIGTLPVGARPATGKRQFWFVYCIDSVNSKSWTRLDIAYINDPDYPGQDGALILITADAIVSSGSGGNNGSIQYLSLSGIRFAAG